jgi:hypothetical protein
MDDWDILTHRVQGLSMQNPGELKHFQMVSHLCCQRGPGIVEKSLMLKTGLAIAAESLLPFGMSLLLALTEFNSPYGKYRLITIDTDYFLIVCTWQGYAIAGLFLLASFYCWYLFSNKEEGDFTSRFPTPKNTDQSSESISDNWSVF